MPRQHKVPPSLFGPWGRKHLAGRIGRKIAQGPEYGPGHKEPAKPKNPDSAVGPLAEVSGTEVGPTPYKVEPSQYTHLGAYDAPFTTPLPGGGEMTAYPPGTFPEELDTPETDIDKFNEFELDSGSHLGGGSDDNLDQTAENYTPSSEEFDAYQEWEPGEREELEDELSEEAPPSPADEEPRGPKAVLQDIWLPDGRNAYDAMTPEQRSQAFKTTSYGQIMSIIDSLFPDYEFGPWDRTSYARKKKPKEGGE